MDRLTELRDKLRTMQPDDPHTLMVRAVYEHELERKFEQFKRRARAAGCSSFVVKTYNNNNGNPVFVPYLPQKKAQRLLAKWIKGHLPPKYWGTHILTPKE